MHGDTEDFLRIGWSNRWKIYIHTSPRLGVMVSILVENIDDILISTGMYPDKKTLLDDSLRALLRAKPELLRTVSIELYRRHEVSLGRAAEICGLNGEEFKELLRERGIFIEVTPETIHEMNADVDALSGAL